MSCNLIKKTLVAIICSMLGVTAWGRSAIADSLRTALSAAPAAEDSLTILRDLYDLVPRTEHEALGQLAVDLALRTGNSAVGLDMVRNLANRHVHSDSLLMEDRRLANQFAASDDRDETLCFIGMMLNNYHFRRGTVEQRVDELHSLLRRMEKNPPANLYDDILMLHSLCLNLSSVSRAQVLSKYLTKLDSLVGQLRPEAYVIRNCFYVQASLAYSNSDIMRERGIEYDRRLLACIDSMQMGRGVNHRPYRDYDLNRYMIYTRLLSNYQALSEEEVEELYDKAMAVTRKDETVARHNSLTLRPQIYLAAKKGNMAEMLPLLKKAVDAPGNANYRRQLLKMMIDAAKATGDRDALVSASLAYSDLLEKTLRDRIHEKWEELEAAYTINEVKSGYERERNSLRDTLLLLAVISAVVLLVMLIAVGVILRRSRRLAKELQKSNLTLKTESDSLRRTQHELVKSREQTQAANHLKSAFIKNMTDVVSVPLHTIAEYTNLIVDCSDAVMRPYLKQFAELVTINSEMVTVMLADMQTLSDIDNGSTTLSPRRESLRPLCEVAIKGVRHIVKPGVELTLAKDLPEVLINTDSRRLLQILWQLLSNAAKFTESGTIELSYELDEEAQTVNIVVSNTGSRIAPENAERIFQRFVKLNPTVPGAGIGLPLARHIAQLLGGKLVLGSSTVKLTSFVLTLPLNYYTAPHPQETAITSI